MTSTSNHLISKLNAVSTALYAQPGETAPNAKFFTLVFGTPPSVVNDSDIPMGKEVNELLNEAFRTGKIDTSALAALPLSPEVKEKIGALTSHDFAIINEIKSKIGSEPAVTSGCCGF